MCSADALLTANCRHETFAHGRSAGGKRPKNVLFALVRASARDKLSEESVTDSPRTGSERKRIRYLDALFLGLRECSMIAS